MLAMSGSTYGLVMTSHVPSSNQTDSRRPCVVGRLACRKKNLPGSESLPGKKAGGVASKEAWGMGRKISKSPICLLSLSRVREKKASVMVDKLGESMKQIEAVSLT